MSDENNGMGFGSLVGGAAVGAGAAALANNHISQRATIKALTKPYAEGTSEKFVEAAAAAQKSLSEKAGIEGASKAVTDLNNDLQKAKTQLGKISMLPKAEKVTDVVFKKTAEGMHQAEITAGGKVLEISGIKELPSGAEAGKALSGDAAKKLFEGEKSYFATVAKTAEGDLAKLTRRAGGFGFGLKNMGMGGRAAVIGTALAGTAVGAYAAHAIFGGKHSDKAMAEPTMEAAQGAAR